MKTMSDMVIERIQTAQQGTELECLKNLDHISIFNVKRSFIL